MMSITYLKNLINRDDKVRKYVYRLAMNILVKPYVSLLRIPVISITGTNGKSTITRLLNRIYVEAGYNVGMCHTDGVMHNGVLISEGDESGGGGVWKAAKCPGVELLILETARRGIIDYGLGYYKSNIGIVTNLFEDHLGYDGINTLEEMAAVKSQVPANVDKNGTVILNGDISLVRDMANNSCATVVFFIGDENHAGYDNVYYLKNGFIYRKIRGNIENVININHVFLTLKGTNKYQISNVMAAIACVEGLNKKIPVSQDIVKKVLSEFGESYTDNTGIFQHVIIDNEEIISCTCKNPEGFRNDLSSIRRIKDNNGFDYIVGVLTAAGNRNENYYLDISRMVSEECDYLFVRPPKEEYLRGRSAEEIVSLLSTCIHTDKLADKNDLSLQEIIKISKSKLSGRILFIVFSIRLEANIDMKKLLQAGPSS